jgi:hypothetical protein
MRATPALICAAFLAGCVAPVPASQGAGVASNTEARESFSFESTATRGRLAYACKPGPAGGGPAVRAAAAHASFDQALAGFAAEQASATMAAINAGRTGAGLDAELKRAGDAFGAGQRGDLDRRFGCIPAGDAGGA